MSHLFHTGVPSVVNITSSEETVFAFTYTLTWTHPHDGGLPITCYEVKYRLVSTVVLVIVRMYLGLGVLEYEGIDNVGH